MDGCSWPGVFFRIIMPNSKPAIATVIILSFRSTWNSFLWPQLVLQTDRLWTWTLALKILSESETNQAVLLAGSVISFCPILIYYLPAKNTLSTPRSAQALAAPDINVQAKDVSIIIFLGGTTP